MVAYSRNEYLQSLNRMRANYQNQGNPLINREDDNGNVGNELSAFAYMNTDTPAPEQASAPKEEKGKSKDFFSQLFGTIDEVASQFGAGFVGAWEGGLDLIANFIGALGDWTNAWDSKIFTDWAKQDIGTALAQWTKTYANFTPWGAIGNLANGNYSNPDFYKGMWEGAKDIFGSAFFASNQLDKDYREDAKEFYQYDDELDTGFGQFLGEAGHTIGFMLPSIMTAGGSGLTGVGAKALATGMMGISAGGKGAEEALNEGANATQALGYGALTGAVEAGTEWIFPDGGASGVVGAKVSGRALKEVVKEMIEEGTEEVVSELLQPLIKTITYDKNAINDYTKGEYYAGVLKAFGSGAIMGGIFSGVHRIKMTRAIGTTGIEIVETMESIDSELERAEKKYKAGKITKADYDEITNRISEMAEDIRAKYNSLTDTQKANFKKMFNKPNEFKTQLVNEETTEYSNIAKSNSAKIEADSLVDENGKPLEFTYDVNTGKVMQATESSDNNFSITSTKPLLTDTNYKEQITFDKIAKEFDVPSSMKKTINSYLDSGSAEKVINYLAKREGVSFQNVLQRLGYEHYLKSNGELISIESSENQITALRKGDKYGNQNKPSLKTSLRTSQERKTYVRQVQESKGAITKRRVAGLTKQRAGQKGVTVDVIKNSYLTKNLKQIRNKLTKTYKLKNVDFVLNDGSLNSGVEEYIDLETGSVSIVINNLQASPETVAMHATYHWLNAQYKQVTSGSNAYISKYIEDLQNAPKKSYDNLSKFDLLVIDRYMTAVENGDNPIEEITADILSGRLNDGVANATAPEEIQEYKNEFWKRAEQVSKKYTRYVDNEGHAMSYDQARFFEDSKFRDRNNGYKLRVAYRATDVDMTELSYDTIGKGAGLYYGAGFYFGFENQGTTWGKSGSQPFYLNITKQLFENRLTIKEAQVKKMVKQINDNVLNVKDADIDTVAHVLYEDAESDLDVVIGLTRLLSDKTLNLLTSDKYELSNKDFGAVAKAIYDVTGADGMIIYSEEEGGGGQQVVVYNPRAVKSIYNLSPSADSDNVMYSNRTKHMDDIYENFYVEDSAETKSAEDYINEAEVNEEITSEDDLVEKNKGSKLNLAVTATEDIALDTYNEKMRKVKPIINKATKKLSRLFGVDIKVGEGIGGYLFDDGTDVGGEPSVPVFFGADTSMKDVEMIGAILGTSAYEYQETVGTVEYTDSGNKFEDTYFLTKVDGGVNEAIIRSGLKYYTLDVKGKKLIITDGNNAIMRTLLLELKERGYLNVEEHYEQKCNVQWLGSDERATLCRNWLQENGENSQNRELRDLIQKCYEVDTFVSNHKLEVFGDYKKGIEPIYDRNFNKLYELAHKEFGTTKIISDIKANSSTVLIEAGADVSKDVKYRINSVKEAFDTALNEILPDNTKFKISYGDLKQTFAELNLAKPKDRATAVNNMIKRLASAEVTIVDVFGENKFRLDEVLTEAQLNEARDIMLSTLSGKAEATKLTKWAKSLNLAKLENSENIRSAKLLKRLNNKVNRSLKNTYGYGDVPTGELQVYSNIIKDIKPFFDNKSMLALADNVLTYYTDENIGELYEYFGITRNPMINALAQKIKENVIAGKHLSPEVMALGNDILQLLDNDLKYVAKVSHDKKVNLAKTNLEIAQSLFGSLVNNGKGDGNLVLGKVSEAVKRLDTSIMSPATYIETIFGKEAPITEHVTTLANEATKSERAHVAEFEDYFFKQLPKECGISDIDKELGKKITFKGETLTLAQALKRLNLEATLGERFYKAKGSKVNKQGLRTDITYTAEDIENLKKLIPENVQEWNNKMLEGLQGKIKDYIKSSYERDTKTKLRTIDEDGAIYYMTSRVSDKALGVKGGGYSARDFDYSDLTERVPNTVADINFNGDVISDLKNYIQKNVHRFEWGQWWKQWTVYLNQRVYGTTLNALLQKNLVGWNNINDLITHDILEIPYGTYKTLFGRIIGGAVSGIQRANVLGLGTALRTISSRPWFASYFGAKISIAGELMSVKHGGMLAVKKNMDIIKRLSPTLKARVETQEVVSAETSQRVSGKLSAVLGTPLRLADGYVVIADYGFSCAQAQAMQEGYGDPYTEKNNVRAVQILEEAVNRTQPTLAPLNVGGFRYGQYGQIIKQTFGMYASMVQSFYTGVRTRIYDMLYAKKYATNMENTLTYHSERMSHYAEEMRTYETAMEEAETDEAYDEASEAYEEAKYHYEEHRNARERLDNYYANWKVQHSARAQANKLAGTLGGFMFASLMFVLFNKLIKKIEGKEEWDDWSAEEIGKSTVEQMFLKSFPYLSTIYASVKNNSDMSVFTVDNLNTIVDAITTLTNSFKTGNIGKISGSALKTFTTLSQFFGIPANAIYKIINGTWYNIDKESNLKYNNWLGAVSASALKRNYNDAYEKGQEERAKANLQVWLYNYSVPSSDTAINEIYKLNRDGVQNVAPSAVMTSYTDQNGAVVKLTDKQINAFKKTYNKADGEITSLLKLGDYKSLDEEYKGKAMKKVYTSYYDYAKARITGVAPTAKVSQLLYYTNGDVDLAKYIAGMQKLALVKEDKRHTRKENVISAINKMSGFNRREKLLLAYLSGYSVSDSNRTQLVSYLVSLGFERKIAQSYLQ